uniref:Uncharacterized protein n=1 Tax=Panagrolaimus davidi TaxID=227884 RepID=A0A914PNX4_9BILA
MPSGSYGQPSNGYGRGSYSNRGNGKFKAGGGKRAYKSKGTRGGGVSKKGTPKKGGATNFPKSKGGFLSKPQKRAVNPGLFCPSDL